MIAWHGAEYRLRACLLIRTHEMEKRFKGGEKFSKKKREA